MKTITPVLMVLALALCGEALGEPVYIDAGHGGPGADIAVGQAYSGVQYHDIHYRLCQDMRYSLTVLCLRSEGGEYAVESAECDG
jgi:hypothetical protein